MAYSYTVFITHMENHRSVFPYKEGVRMGHWQKTLFPEIANKKKTPDHPTVDLSPPVCHYRRLENISLSLSESSSLGPTSELNKFPSFCHGPGKQRCFFSDFWCLGKSLLPLGFLYQPG
jgi:hypothetical protein